MCEDFVSLEILVIPPVTAWPRSTTKGQETTPSALPLRGGGQNGKKKANLVGRDEGGLTGQQGKRTVITTTIMTSARERIASPPQPLFLP